LTNSRNYGVTLTSYFDQEFLLSVDSDDESEADTVYGEIQMTLSKLSSEQAQAVLDYAKGMLNSPSTTGARLTKLLAAF
jgi:hypothetical protein